MFVNLNCDPIFTLFKFSIFVYITIFVENYHAKSDLIHIQRKKSRISHYYMEMWFYAFIMFHLILMYNEKFLIEHIIDWITWDYPSRFAGKQLTNWTDNRNSIIKYRTPWHMSLCIIPKIYEGHTDICIHLKIKLTWNIYEYL